MNLARPASQTACRLWLIAVSGIALIAAITGVVGGGGVRSALGLTFPARPHVTDFALVCAHNLTLTGALLLAAKHPTRPSDALIAVAWAANIALAGVAIGGYGARLLEHAVIYGLGELAAFSFAIGTYLDARARRRAPTLGDAIVIASLVVASAALETVAAIRL
jgi:hypothetical protein